MKDPKTGKEKKSLPTYTGKPGEPVPIPLRKKHRRGK